MEDLQNIVIYGTGLGLINSPTYKGYCLHCICTSGEATFCYFDREIIFRASQMIVIPDTYRISGLCLSDDFQCEYVMAPNEYLTTLLPANSFAIPGAVSLTQNPVINLVDEDICRLHEDFIGIMRRMGNTSHSFYQEMLGNLLRTMMYDIFDVHYKRDGGDILQTSRVGYVVTKFISMIQEGMPTTQRSPAWYADKLNISVKYLGETVTRITGSSVSDHINRAAAATLRDYIEKSDRSITEIAEIMNFNSLSYLNRFCKHHLGYAPLELRRLKKSAVSSLTKVNQ